VLLGAVADRLDVVAVGVEDVRAVVVRVVDRSLPRRTVVGGACFERGGVEPVDALTVVGAKGDVQSSRTGLPCASIQKNAISSVPNPAAWPLGSAMSVMPSGARASW
jgi:hypothetical protein